MSNDFEDLIEDLALNFIDEVIIKLPPGWKKVRVENNQLVIPPEFSNVIDRRNQNLNSTEISAKFNSDCPLIELYDEYIRHCCQATSDDSFVRIPYTSGIITIDFKDRPFENDFLNEPLVLFSDVSKKHLQLSTCTEFKKIIGSYSEGLIPFNESAEVPFESLGAHIVFGENDKSYY